MWGGAALNSISCGGLFFFSLLVFFEGDLCLAWFFLELAGLSLIPLFFSLTSSGNMVGLFYYLIISGVSSGLLLSGILFEDCVLFMVMGLLLKFGIFPFMGWVYSVLACCNWLVVWGFSTVLKSSFIFISFFLVVFNPWSNMILLSCCMSCLVASVLFWIFSVSWKVCWCHMALSSSSVLVCLSFFGSSLDSLLFLYLFYIFWATLVILFFYFDSYSDLSGNNYILFSFYFCFLLLTLPLSFSVFYKICVCISLFFCGIPFLFCWLIYSVSEQAYLLFSLVGYFGEKGTTGFSFIV